MPTPVNVSFRVGPRGLSCLTLTAWLGTVLASPSATADDSLRAELIFPLHPEHNHAPGVAELPSGDLFVTWYRGSGERKADDVAVYGSRLRAGESTWSPAFRVVDTPGFPDGNTALHLDAKGRLWLFWPVVIANTWESCQTNFLVSSDFEGEVAPRWDWRGTLYLKPKNFAERMLQGIDERLSLGPLDELSPENRPRVESLVRDKLAARLGWQTRCKPTVLPSGRILLPLYSDTFSAGLMAISDDDGKTWFASEPLAGYGSIQPAVLRRKDGTLVAYMRENGPLDKIRVAESTDDGVSWGKVGVCELPNPGSGVDGVVLASGRWLLIYNDTLRGRHQLAVSMSDDEGQTWKWTRHLERHETGGYHYPAIIQGRDETVHAVYSYFVDGGKSMKHAAFTEAWIESAE